MSSSAFLSSSSYLCEPHVSNDDIESYRFFLIQNQPTPPSFFCSLTRTSLCVFFASPKINTIVLFVCSKYVIKAEIFQICSTNFFSFRPFCQRFYWNRFRKFFFKKWMEKGFFEIFIKCFLLVDFSIEIENDFELISHESTWKWRRPWRKDFIDFRWSVVDGQAISISTDTKKIDFIQKFCVRRAL